MDQSYEGDNSDAIAIVGMAARLPGARNPDEYWQMLKAGRLGTRWLTDDELLAEGVSPEELRDPNYVRAANILSDMEMFDAGFFGFSPREADILDPQHRHFLELCWEVLEDAGHMPENFDGAIGVYAGSGMQAYMPYNLLTNPELVKNVGLFLLRHTGNDKDFLTTRASYLLDLQGPSINIQTACSTSLVAIHEACQSLLSGECDMALAGGVTIELPHRRGYHYAEGEILSPDGLCRAFDDAGTGTIFGSGGGLVALRRLEDALADGDNVRAIIASSAINNDGSQKAGYLAPSVDGQAGAVAEALAVGGISPETVSYIEAHGTGTAVGDPIELTALREAYGANLPSESCGIGSVKTNIGHLDTAAGVASLIKVVLSLENEALPPTLNFEQPNSRFDFSESPFYVQDTLQAWPRASAPRRAGVNSLGVGGTNAHAILEEAPKQTQKPSSERIQIFPFSARTEKSADALLNKWSLWLSNENKGVIADDAAFTLQTGRRQFDHRRAAIATDLSGLKDVLRDRNASKRFAKGKAISDTPGVVFMFPGGGAQFPGVGRELYETLPVFRSAIDDCIASLPEEAPADLKEAMFAKQSDLERFGPILARPTYALPTLFALEYAYARLWMSWGIKPTAMIGHSAGEYVAACIAGALTLKDALAIIFVRAQLFEVVPEGRMVSIGLPEREVRDLIGESLDIAAVNGESACVVSGSEAAVEELAHKLSERDIPLNKLRINVAAHSRMLDSQLEGFRRKLESIRFSDLSVPCISNLNGDWASGDDMTTVDYWVRHLRNTVRYGDGISKVLEKPNQILLEVGPGQSLGALAQLAQSDHEPISVLSSTRAPNEVDSDLAYAMTTAASLWCCGADIDWAVLREERDHKKVALPTYAFEKEYHWIEPGSGGYLPVADSEQSETSLSRIEDISNWFSTHELIKIPSSIGTEDCTGRWLIFGDDCDLHRELVERIGIGGGEVTSVYRGDEFKAGDRGYWVAPGDWESFEALVDALEQTGGVPTKIVYMWPLVELEQTDSFIGAIGFCRSLQLSGAAGEHRIAFTTGLSPSNPDQLSARPTQSAYLGLSRVLPRECPGLFAQQIDLVDVGDAASAILETILEPALHELVVYEEAERLTQRIVPTETQIADGLPDRLRENGVYCITGGLGGIGLKLANYLFETAHARLALIGRSELPPREKWSSEISAAPFSQKTEVLQALIDLESRGAELCIVKADVTSEAEVNNALEKIVEKFGPINGIIHAAGAIDDGPLASKTADSVKKVLAPKWTGTRVLDKLIPDGSVDFFAVFSSTSLLIGPPGQADYASANAVISAHALARKDGLCIDWGVWSGVGLAQKTYGAELPDGRVEDHPFLGIRESQESSVHYSALYRPHDLWVLNEHRLGGTPVFPGTGYVEIAAAAARVEFDQCTLEIQNLSFESPMRFAGDVPRLVLTSLKPSPHGYELEIASKSIFGDTTTRHAVAEVHSPSEDEIPSWVDTLLGVRAEDCDQIGIRYPDPEVLEFGERWRSIKFVGTAPEETTLGLIELPPRFDADFNTFETHPSLLDIAATIGLQSIEDGYGSDGLYVPISVKRVKLYAPISGSLKTTARLVDAEVGRFAVFNVAVTDAEGRLLAVLEQFALRRVSLSTINANIEEEGSSLIEEMMTKGIRAEDADEVFGRVFNSKLRRLTVSSIELPQLRHALTVSLAPTQQGEQNRSEGSSGDYSDKVEGTLAEIWSNLLGVEGIGVDEDFFDLGGHSLAAVRLFAQIRKAYGVSLPLSSLFEAPTISKLALLVKEEADIPEEQAADSVVQDVTEPVAIESVQAPEAKRAWSPLVRICAGEPGRQPLFGIHGAGGNVLYFNALSRHLGRDQPFYALEALGADGRNVEPHQTIEEMAACYLDAIRTIQPHGPYHITGYSGGGVIAYEIAQMLRKENDRAELVIMLDTICPAAVSKSATPIQHFKNTLKNPRYPIALLRAIKKQKDTMRAQADMLLRTVDHAMRGDDLPLDAIEFKISRHFANVQRKYEVTGYPGDIVIMRAMEAGLFFTRGGKQLGWQDHVSGSIEVIEFDCSHATMVSEPTIGEVAKAIRRHLDAKNVTDLDGADERLVS